MIRTNFKTFASKMELKKLLSYEYLTLTEISKKLSVSKPGLYAELKKGLTPDDYILRKYVKYDPEKSQTFEVEEILKKATGKAEEKMREMMEYKQSVQSKE